jgi:transcriptional regulator with XRE-family HTH domain
MARKFANWLMAQMQERNWTQADLARASGVHKQSIHYYLTQSVKPPRAYILAKLAAALDLPVEEAYRAAHIPLHPSDVNQTIEEVLYEMETMSGEDQQEVLAFVRMKRKLREQRKNR